jgi:hypothetical protein
MTAHQPLVDDPTVALLRSIKKTAAVLLLIMHLDPKPIGESEVAELLQINRETARLHLKQLSYSRLIARSARFQGYILTHAGRQLLLTTAENPPSIPSTITTNYIEETLVSEAVPVEESQTTAEYPRLTAENPRSIELVQALKDAGVGEPKRSSLTQLKHITPQLIKAWEKHLKKDKSEKYHVGLLIHCLESGDLPPGQSIGEDSRQRYVQGPYAEFIIH